MTAARTPKRTTKSTTRKPATSSKPGPKPDPRKPRSRHKPPAEQLGRPSELRRIVTTRTIKGDDKTGEPDRHEDVDVFEMIVGAVENGNYVEMAAGLAGVNAKTVYRWLATGARIAKARHDPIPSIDLHALTPHELDCEEFRHAVDQAEALAFSRHLRAIDRLCEGGRAVVSTTVEQLPNGRTRTTTKTEHTLPDAATVRWRAERRWPRLLGRLDRVELTGAEGGALQIEERSAADVLLADLERIAERAAKNSRLLAEATETNGTQESSKPRNGKR